MGKILIEIVVKDGKLSLRGKNKDATLQEVCLAISTLEMVKQKQVDMFSKSVNKVEEDIK